MSCRLIGLKGKLTVHSSAFTCTVQGGSERKVSDLFKDLQDGLILTDLLKILTGVELVGEEASHILANALPILSKLCSARLNKSIRIFWPHEPLSVSSYMLINEGT